MVLARVEAMDSFRHPAQPYHTTAFAICCHTGSDTWLIGFAYHNALVLLITRFK